MAVFDVSFEESEDTVTFLFNVGKRAPRGMPRYIW